MSSPKRAWRVKDAKLSKRLKRLAVSLSRAKGTELDGYPVAAVPQIPAASLRDLGRRLGRLLQHEDARVVFGQSTIGRPARTDAKQVANEYWAARAMGYSKNAALKRVADKFGDDRTPATITRLARQHRDTCLAELERGANMFTNLDEPHEPPLDIPALRESLRRKSARPR